MSELVVIRPLTQSGVETASCGESYVAIYIDGRSTGPSTASERGSDVHAVMAKYISYCSQRKVEADWEHMNALSATSGPVAGPILDGMRDRYIVDWAHVYGTEISLGMDEQFRPAYRMPPRVGRYPKNLDKIPGIVYSEEYVAYVGTIDLLLLSDDSARGKIEDFKSAPSPFDADTFQVGLYVLMVFKHLPELQTITFELNFLRYTNCLRSARFSRTDIPTLQAEASRARARQRALHESPQDAFALPGKQCVYCAKGKDFSCSIAEWNEYTILTDSDRLRWKMWLGKMNAINNPILKAHAEVRGSVTYQDGNNRVFEYANQPVPQTRIPLDVTATTLLATWKSATGEDLLDGRLNISSTKLKQLLKAKKRAELKDQFESSSFETSTAPKWAIRTPDEGFVADYDPYAQE